MEKSIEFLIRYGEEILWGIIFMFLWGACYRKWNDIWYNVGKNIYYVIHCL